MGRPSRQDDNPIFSKEPSKAVEEMMDCYGSLVIRTAYFYVGDRHLAEDISQEAFMKAYRNWEKFRGDSSVKTWIIRITINLCHDKMRLKGWTEQPTEPSYLNGPLHYNLEEEVIKRLNKTQILKHVLNLPSHYQEVLYLYYYLDLNTVEIAYITRNPEGTVRGRLHRGRKLLGETLKKEGFDYDQSEK
ncbi:sigma-70 family RNA polymerase sigma factor [Neobacillus sp. PS3-40]|uniref:sigma-70 family RNA polymerase sigma factor n=1 Tax=Neobacillus sp. PS3-40 TaxID=3070679 RepID=UPI0027E12DEA|nr:sigma-70 family RNA polymerase sigma factor [Neobacillus sp. PS3-40]WML44189.1 sigma-70 family RNA polymerase sigma factor [Neobacillus sp. PS3-40]